MLKIKLTRIGKRNQPHFRIVVNEARDKRDGKYVESLGHYAPAETPKILKIDSERFEHWLKQGAQPTETVAALYTRFKSEEPFPAKTKQKLNRKAKARLAAEKSASAEAKADEETKAAKAAEVKAEKPAEETKEATPAPEAEPETKKEKQEEASK